MKVSLFTKEHVNNNSGLLDEWWDFPSGFGIFWKIYQFYFKQAFIFENVKRHQQQVVILIVYVTLFGDVSVMPMPVWDFVVAVTRYRFVIGMGWVFPNWTGENVEIWVLWLFNYSWIYCEHNIVILLCYHTPFLTTDLWDDIVLLVCSNKMETTYNSITSNKLPLLVTFSYCMVGSSSSGSKEGIVNILN